MVSDSAKRHSSLESDLSLNWILSSLKKSFHRKTVLGTWTNNDATISYSALVAAFDAALNSSCHRAVEVLYDTCQQFGYTAYYAHVDPYVTSVVMQACTDREWAEAIRAVSKIEAAPVSYKPAPSQHDEAYWDQYYKTVDDLVRAEDVQTLERFLDEDADPFEWAYDSVDCDSDAIAALAATFCGLDGVLNLLRSRRTSAVSFLLCRYSHWTELLQDQSQTSRFDDLEDYLYRREYHEYCRRFPCCLETPRSRSHQIVLRALSYHAIHRRDTALIQWLHDHGLATTGMQVLTNENYSDFSVICSHPCQEDRLLKPYSEYYYYYADRLPSLLEVATMQGHDLRTLESLLDRQITYRDSAALLHTVQSKSQPEIIGILLSANPPGAIVSRMQYGSAALRVAIRHGNHDLVRLLATVADIHGLEQIHKDDNCLDHLDPLGEAVLRKDRTAVQNLLENGGDVNTIVAFNGLPKHAIRSASNSVLLRMTPLLVAIDMGEHDMVEFLVDNGAEINRNSRLGLLRTPLQRAAEVGDFNLVQYLISKSAAIDSAPVYGGGTALQLAAMSGHLGIASLLIEKGANVNHPPARGPGRTAFEAAAEWCRPDMMHLLVQKGALSHLEVEEEVDEAPEKKSPSGYKTWRTVRTSRSQYERALQFVESRKDSASKVVLENIGMQLGLHLSDNSLRITE